MHPWSWPSVRRGFTLCTASRRSSSHGLSTRRQLVSMHVCAWSSNWVRMGLGNWPVIHVWLVLCTCACRTALRWAACMQCTCTGAPCAVAQSGPSWCERGETSSHPLQQTALSTQKPCTTGKPFNLCRCFLTTWQLSSTSGQVERRVACPQSHSTAICLRVC